MKTTKSIIVNTIFIVLIFSNNLLLAQDNLAEEWEKAYLNLRQPPEKIMKSIELSKGMTIGEIGAGRGRITVYLARETGPAGKVYANDIDEKSLSYLKGRASRQGFKNIETITGKPDDPRFLDNSLDMAIMVLTYHMIESPDSLLKNIKKSLKPGANLVIMDPVDKEIDREFGIDRSKPGNLPPTIKERVARSAKICGYDIIKIDSSFTNDYIFFLKPNTPDKKYIAAELIKEKMITSGIDAGKKRFEQIKSDASNYLWSQNTFINTGYEFYGRRTMPEAIAILKMGAELFPESTDIYNSLGEIYLVHGDKEKAKTSFEKSVEINPENGFAQYALKNLDQIFKDMHPGE